MSAVAQASASAQVRATTLTDAGEASTGAPPDRVHGVREAVSLHLDPVTVIAGGRHGGVL
jgi:hypothetical protein